MSDDERTQGIDFGDLADALAAHDYPASASELRQEYGGHDLDLPKGSAEFGDVLARLEDDQTFQDADEVRTVVLSLVGDDAVGEEGQSGRGGPVSGADETSGTGDREG